MNPGAGLLSAPRRWPAVENGFTTAHRGDWHKEVIGACPSDGWMDGHVPVVICVRVCEYVCPPPLPPPPSTITTATRLLVWIRLICGQWKQAAPIAVLCLLLILNLQNEHSRARADAGVNVRAGRQTVPKWD